MRTHIAAHASVAHRVGIPERISGVVIRAVSRFLEIRHRRRRLYSERPLASRVLPCLVQKFEAPAVGCWDPTRWRDGRSSACDFLLSRRRGGNLSKGGAP